MTKDEREFFGRGCAVVLMIGTAAAVVLVGIAALGFIAIKVFG